MPTDSTKDFRQVQFDFAAHLRDPDHVPAPDDVEDRRMAIYRDLIFNNIEGFISSGFPITRQLYSDAGWHRLVRDFIRHHKAHTPYFLEIGEEFLHYLQNQRDLSGEPPFLLELAHYEWVELALDVSTETFPGDVNPDGDPMTEQPVVSPLAWNLSYQFPVHRIGPTFQPAQPPAQPTFLVVYRNRDDQVQFMEANAATSRLLTLLDGEDRLTGQGALEILARELQAPDPRTVMDFGQDLLQRLQSQSIICGTR